MDPVRKESLDLMMKHVLDSFLKETWEKQFIKILIILFLVCNGLHSFVRNFDWYTDIEKKRDFLSIYLMACALYNNEDYTQPLNILSQKNPTIPSNTYFPHPTPHPPTMGLLLMPLAFFDYYTARMIWLFMQIAFLLCSILLISYTLRRPFRIYESILIVVIIQVWSPVVQDLFQGQLNIFLLLNLVCMGTFWNKKRSFLSGMMLGIGLLIKQIIWPIFLLFLLFKDKIAAIACAVVVLLGYGIVGMYSGSDRLIYYCTEILPLNAKLYQDSPYNCSLWILGRFFKECFHQPDPNMNSVTITPLIPLPFLASCIEWGIPLLFFLILLFYIRKFRDRDIGFSTLVCACLLVNPYVWLHYQILLIIPIFQILKELDNLGLVRLKWVIWVMLFLVFDIAYTCHNRFVIHLKDRLLTESVKLNFWDTWPMLIQSLVVIFLLFLLFSMHFEYTEKEENRVEKKEKDGNGSIIPEQSSLKLE